jgi:hypothetical protein
MDVSVAVGVSVPVEVAVAGRVGVSVAAGPGVNVTVALAVGAGGTLCQRNHPPYIVPATNSAAMSKSSMIVPKILSLVVVNGIP